MPRDPFAPVLTDPVAVQGRRRRRRLFARYRRPVLAVGVALLVLLLVPLVAPGRGARDGPGSEPGAAEEGPPRAALAGRVLVTVLPAEPSVLAIALPGRLVDVYAVSTWDVGAPPAAQRLAHRALVVTLPGAAGPIDAGPLSVTTTSSALAVAVEPAEAARIASAQGQAITVAVLPEP